MSLRDELDKRIPEVLRERYGASDSQLKAAAQGALRTFGENIVSQQEVLRPPAAPFIATEVTQEIVMQQTAPIPVESPSRSSAGGTPLPLIDVYVGVAGIVHLAHIAGTVDP